MTYMFCIVLVFIAVYAPVKILRRRGFFFGRLRKKYKTLDTFYIKKSDRLFGFFWEHTPHDYTFKAYNAAHALERLINRYERVYKKKHEMSKRFPHETTSNWGVYQVINARTGYRTYFN